MDNTINVRCCIVGLGPEGTRYRIPTSKEAIRLIEGCFNSYNFNHDSLEPFNEVKFSLSCDNCSVRDLHNAILKAFNIDITIPAIINDDTLKRWPELIVKVKNDFIISIEDESMNLSSLIERFHLTKIESYLVIVLGRGDFLREDGFRFFFKSHEGNKHNKPHVHVETSNHKEGSIDILTLEQNKGSRLKRHEITKIQKILKGKQKELLEAWNLQTDGIYVDLDILLGQVKPIK